METPFETNTPFESLRRYTWRSILATGRPFEISFVHWNDIDARTSLLKHLAKVKKDHAEKPDMLTYKHMTGFKSELGYHSMFDFTEDTLLHDGTTIFQLIVRGKPDVEQMNYCSIVVR